ncbi:MAG: XRE family transcriptional regulator [Pseudomonadota bacterium]
MDVTVGTNIRALRKSRGMTLEGVAEELGCSVGWLSQVERGKSEPQREDIHAISDVLGCSVSLLLGNAPGPKIEQGYVVRAKDRTPVKSRPGLAEELLSPDLSDEFEVVRSVFAPGSSLGEVHARPTQEIGYLVSGRLTMTIAGRRFELEPGDSFRIRGDAFEWENPHDEPAVAIWVIAPPIY